MCYWLFSLGGRGGGFSCEFNLRSVPPPVGRAEHVCGVPRLLLDRKPYGVKEQEDYNYGLLPGTLYSSQSVLWEIAESNGSSRTLHLTGRTK